MSDSKHACCIICKKKCKQEWMFWSGMMPCSIYCKEFEEEE